MDNTKTLNSKYEIVKKEFNEFISRLANDFDFKKVERDSRRGLKDWWELSSSEDDEEIEKNYALQICCIVDYINGKNTDTFVENILKNNVNPKNLKMFTKLYIIKYILLLFLVA